MNKKEIEDFENIVIDIDKTRLDDEAENQPRKVWIYGKMYAKAIQNFDEKSAELRVVEADLDALVREDPASFDLGKITEPAVKRAILRSREYQDALTKVNEAKYKVILLEKALETLDHRRTSLTMLNKQDERNYFSRTKFSQESTESFRNPKKKKKKD